MDEYELNPTGLRGSFDEDIKLIRDSLLEDEQQDQGSAQPLIEEKVEDNGIRRI